uniref:Uncharacterized protein n=1 Tax=Romanomermis culicivorax TaxID=13658 RepID=A0A915KKH1_ROMCU
MLTRTTHPKLLTFPKILKKKKKKQKDDWNKSPTISNDEHPSLQPKKVYKYPKCLRAAVTSSMKSGLMHHLTNLLGFPALPIYELEDRPHIDAVNNPPLPTDVDDVRIEHVAPDQPLPDPTYHCTHYR